MGYMMLRDGTQWPFFLSSGTYSLSASSSLVFPGPSGGGPNVLSMAEHSLCWFLTAEGEPIHPSKVTHTLGTWGSKWTELNTCLRDFACGGAEFLPQG